MSPDLSHDARELGKRGQSVSPTNAYVYALVYSTFGDVGLSVEWKILKRK